MPKLVADRPALDLTALERLTPEGPTEFGMTRICEISGLYEKLEGEAAELWREDDSGRLFVRAYNEGGNRNTDLCLPDLVRRLSELATRADLRRD